MALDRGNVLLIVILDFSLSLVIFPMDAHFESKLVNWFGLVVFEWFAVFRLYCEGRTRGVRKCRGNGSKLCVHSYPITDTKVYILILEFSCILYAGYVDPSRPGGSNPTRWI